MREIGAVSEFFGHEDAVGVGFVVGEGFAICETKIRVKFSRRFKVGEGASFQTEALVAAVFGFGKDVRKHL
jgi:hypothetical protein